MRKTMSVLKGGIIAVGGLWGLEFAANLLNEGIRKIQTGLNLDDGAMLGLALTVVAAVIGGVIGYGVASEREKEKDNEKNQKVD